MAATQIFNFLADLELASPPEGLLDSRSKEFYVDNAFWPEQRSRLHYFLQDGQLHVELRNEAQGENSEAGTVT